MPSTVKILSALAEPTRLKALSLIWNSDELCVCELMNKLKATQSRMSRHMAVLKKAGLVIDRRDAQWVRYRCNPNLPKPLAALVEAALKLEKPLKGKRHEVLCRMRLQ